MIVTFGERCFGFQRSPDTQKLLVIASSSKLCEAEERLCLTSALTIFAVIKLMLAGGASSDV